jgi:hypothetical protein
MEATQRLVIRSTTSPLVTREVSRQGYWRIFCNCVATLLSISTFAAL